MNDSEFDDFLKTARADAPLPALFKQGVWHRIGSEALEMPFGVSRFEVFSGLVRPWGAAAGIAATVAMGLWLGVATAPEPGDGKVAYATSISPFAHNSHE